MQYDEIRYLPEEQDPSMTFSHHLGYHGIRCLYHKQEKRNLVVPLVSWLNLQSVVLAGMENDPVDERAWAGCAIAGAVRVP